MHVACIATLESVHEQPIWTSETVGPQHLRQRYVQFGPHCDDLHNTAESTTKEAYQKLFSYFKFNLKLLMTFVSSLVIIIQKPDHLRRARGCLDAQSFPGEKGKDKVLSSGFCKLLRLEPARSLCK